MIEGLHKVSLRIPDFFEDSLGYHRDSTFVAFYWDLAVGEFRFFDGHLDAEGIWYSWLLFSRHSYSSMILSEFNFGSSKKSAVHWLLLDRRTRELWAGEKNVVEAFIKENTSVPWIDPPEGVAEEEFYDHLAKQLEEELARKMSVGEVEEMIKEDAKRIDRLQEWLDENFAQCCVIGTSTVQ